MNELLDKIGWGHLMGKYYIVFLTVITMTVVGYFSFDNWSAILIFGVVVGGIFGVIIDSIAKK